MPGRHGHLFRATTSVPMPRSPLTSDPEPDLSRNRGGAAVGTITDLDPVATAAVLYLRLWCDGPHGKARHDLH